MPIATAAPRIVSEVIVPLGEYPLSVVEIRDAIQTRPGLPFDPAIVDADIRRLYETNAFSSIQVCRQETEDHKVIVRFRLTPWPSMVNEVVYEGARLFDATRLQSITRLHKGQPLNPITNLNARWALLRAYQEAGRMAARVELGEGGHVGDTRILFHIEEGPRIYVSQLAFEGNNSVETSELELAVKANLVRHSLLRNIYTPGTCNWAQPWVERYYRSIGFRNVVVTAEVTWGADAEKATLLFHIQEGTRTEPMPPER
jgi:outer membrane protein assembly factor BamA